MLRFFAKFQRSKNLVLIIFCAVLLLGLISLYAIPSQGIPGLNRVSGDSGDNAVIARVGSQDITLKEYRTALAGLAATYSRGGTISTQLIRGLGLDRQALNKLVEDRLVLEEGQRLGLQGTDREVSDQITKMPGFINPDTNQFIGQDEYRRALALRGETISDFEHAVRAGVTTDKVRNFLASAAQVSDKDIEDEFKRDNTKVEVVYTVVDKEKIKDKIKLTDADLQDYYNSHKDEFKATEPVRKVEYLFVPTEKAGALLTITDDQLRAEYEKSKQFEPRLSIIKLNVASPQDEQTVRAKADELAQKARENNDPKEFAKIAQGNSQDPSAKNGGDIGFIKKEPNKPNDWKQRALGLKKGAIDGPFREGSAWYIMTVTDERQVPFEEMKPTLRAGVQNRSAYGKANELTDEAYAEFTKTKDLRKTAEMVAAKLKVPADSLIRTTPYFKNGDTLPEIGSNPAFEEAVAQLKKTEIGEKIGVPNGMAIPRLVDLKEGGAQLSFDDARNQVESKLRRDREANLAQQVATEISAKAKSPAEFRELAKQYGLEVKEDANNLAGYRFSNLQQIQQVRSTVLGLKEGEVAKLPVKVGVNYLAFAATKRTEADLSKLPAERQFIRQRLLADRGNLAYESFIQSLSKKYQDTGKIKIYQDVIDNFLKSQIQQQ